MMAQKKSVFILLGITAIAAATLIGLLIYSFLTPSPEVNEAIIPTPTPIPYTRDENGNFNFTPLQKTTISVTRASEIEEKEKVISKTTTGNITTYQIESATPGEIDEIKTRNGTVIFESINTFNKVAGTPPKETVYEREFGQPETILDSVSPLGKHISAHIYAEDGFTLFVNRYTQTVYEIHRYTPMTTQDYQEQYAEYIQAAPEYPQEGLN